MTAEDTEKAIGRFREKLEILLNDKSISEDDRDWNDFTTELFNLAFLEGWNRAYEEVNETLGRHAGIEHAVSLIVRSNQQRHEHLRQDAYRLDRWRR